MLFSHLSFILFFLPLVAVAVMFSPPRMRSAIMLMASGLFYLWGSPLGFALLVLSGAVDFVIARRLAGAPRGLLALLVAYNLAILGYFKYFDFFVRDVLFIPLGEAAWWHGGFLPLGISFITFHRISYAVDVWRGTRPAATLAGFYEYLLFFPKLYMGPITRYSRFAAPEKYDQLNDLYEGFARFVVGLAKKALLADALGRVADAAFALNPADLSPAHAWVGALSYTFQIYFDFSGYTDMALGLALMLGGYRLPENFNRPYLSGSFTEFWRRWHITLSEWFREYVYIPLGGNRAGQMRTYLNLWIVFLLSGLWHGAAWTFILWGAFHGLCISLDKAGWMRPSIMQRISWPLTFVLLVFSWVIFRSTSAGFAFEYMHAMLGNGAPPVTLMSDIIDNRGMFTLALAAVLSLFPEGVVKLQRQGGAFEALRAGALLLTFAMSIMAMAGGAYESFLYMDF